VSAEDVPAHRDRFNLLPNLQLLGGTANVEKQDKAPGDWMTSAFADDDQRPSHEHSNDLDGLPLNLGGFLAYSEQRRERCGHGSKSNSRLWWPPRKRAPSGFAGLRRATGGPDLNGCHDVPHDPPPQREDWGFAHFFGAPHQCVHQCVHHARVHAEVASVPF
jgi:hypothetical protein